MGEQGDTLIEYLNETHQTFEGYNQQDYINWLSGYDVEVKTRDFHISRDVLDNLMGEISLIANPTIKEWVCQCLFHSPPEFWIKPSAYHEGHHPKDELGKWGNLKHVKRVVKIAVMLAEIENLSTHNKDLLISACLIHDIGKYGTDGSSEKIQRNHPTLVRQMAKDTLDGQDKNAILTIAESHMGRWYNPRPETLLQWMCHYADYIASRDTIIIPIVTRGLEQ